MMMMMMIIIIIITTITITNTIIQALRPSQHHTPLATSKDPIQINAAQSWDMACSPASGQELNVMTMAWYWPKFHWNGQWSSHNGLDFQDIVQLAQWSELAKGSNEPICCSQLLLVINMPHDFHLQHLARREQKSITFHHPPWSGWSPRQNEWRNKVHDKNRVPHKVCQNRGTNTISWHLSTPQYHYTTLCALRCISLLRTVGIPPHLASLRKGGPQMCFGDGGRQALAMWWFRPKNMRFFGGESRGKAWEFGDSMQEVAGEKGELSINFRDHWVRILGLGIPQHSPIARPRCQGTLLKKAGYPRETDHGQHFDYPKSRIRWYVPVQVIW